MTKEDIIEKMAKDAGISKAAAGKVLESFMYEVKKTVKKGQKVSLVGFGTFSVTKRAARKGRNPHTGETIKIKASKTPKFKAGKGFRDAVVGRATPTTHIGAAYRKKEGKHGGRTSTESTGPRRK